MRRIIKIALCAAAMITGANGQTGTVPQFVINEAFSAGGSGHDEILGVETDFAGNIYVCGRFTDKFAAGPFDTLTSASSTGSNGFVAKFDYNGFLQWAEPIYSTNAALATDLTVDPMGNVYVVGMFYGEANISGNPLTGTMSEAFVAKYDPNGLIQWVVAAGGNGDEDYGMTIAYDKHHDWLFVGASVGGSATFGTQTYVGGSTKNAVLAKYDPADGNCLQVVGASDWGNSEPSDIAVRGNTVAFCGYIAGQVAFGDHTLNSGGMRDALFATFSADSMICQWASAGGGPGADYASGVAFLPNGDLYFVGVVDSGGTFDGAYLSSTTGAYDFFIARYHGSGGIQWISKSQSSDRADSVRAPGDPPMYIAADDLGNAFVTGSFGDVSQLGPFSIVSNGLEDVFLAKIAPNDSVCWVKSYGGAKQDRAYAIDFTSQREILFAGYFNQEADYGIHHLISADTLADGFVARAKEPHGLFITRPRKNGLMVIGEEYAISWNSKNVGLISIEYTATGPTGWTQIEPVVNAQDGHFLWTVPA
ncbi:MAG: hypothetical protein GF419_12295, partial [Ignavibacteriales bacterium]|nr:hypothetical protein [Ignavibacteriales bacterium]